MKVSGWSVIANALIATLIASCYYNKGKVEMLDKIISIASKSESSD